MNIYEFFPLIKYINLDERVDRKELAEKEFAKIGINPERFSAIKRDNGAEGCYLSHLNLLKEAEKRNENLLVFEDDVQFCDDAKEIIEKSLDEMKDLDWCLWYGAGNILKPFCQVSEYLAKLNHCQSTVFYGVNKKYLPRIIEFVEMNQTFIDIIYADGIIPQTNCYITVPMVGIQRTDYSNIEKTVMSYDVPIERYKKNLIPKENKNGFNLS
jgi:glycosyl transferase family 25